MPTDRLAQDIALALVAGRWKQAEIQKRIRGVVGSITPAAVRDLSRELHDQADALQYRSHSRLRKSLSIWRQFHIILKALTRHERQHVLVLDSPLFMPIEKFSGLAVPQLATIEDLRCWLAIDDEELNWMADAHRTLERAPSDRLLHYSYRWIPRRSGNYRLLEAPKDRLKAIQQKILSDILDCVPCHSASHGFVIGRSILTATSPHAGEDVVLAMDLREFFPMTNLGRVYALFRRIGYPHMVARSLTDLCTTVTPSWVFSQHRSEIGLARFAGALYRRRHLPQGAPTSPALANLVAFRLDCRLSRLASSLDGRYSRYADDLIFSGDAGFRRGLATMVPLIDQIVNDEGYVTNALKTRIMRRNGRQSILGLTVNDHLNIRREAYDALKAILTNCRRSGPASQNRDGHGDFRAHLAGRVAWVEQVNPNKGLKLRRIYDDIVW